MDQHGIKADAIRGVPDLERFPVTRKGDLQALPLADRLAAGAEPSRLIVHSTSGSTGQPFQIYRSWFEERLLGAYRWRVLARYGYRPGHRHAEIEELQPSNNGDRRGLHESLGRLGLFRQRRIHCLQEPGAILEELVSAAPDALTGYAGVVSRVAAAALSSGETRIRPNFVGVHSDQLTAGMRQEIGRAFQAPVFEIYDAYELNVIAWECPTGGGLHTSDATAVVQVVDDRGPVAEGAQGEVVFTALHSLNMPFIRYSAGDLAHRAGPCPCGRGGRLSSVD
jgi:phenylacetate-CoA ligase